MKYKEFQTGSIPVNSTYQRFFEETCGEYSTASIEVVNRGTTVVDVKAIGGWDSIAAYLALPTIYGITVNQSDFSPSPQLTAAGQNNVAIRLIRAEGISAAGQIAANNGQAAIYMSTADMQNLYFNMGRAGSGDAEAYGIFKGGLEGVSATFETATITNGNPSGWIDCRAYSTMAFEVHNTGATALSGLQGARRRHTLITSTVGLVFGLTDTFSTNPLDVIQQVRNGTPGAASATGRTAIDINIGDLHSIQFSVGSGTCVVRGVLKG
jgi:hypothetical protein